MEKPKYCDNSHLEFLDYLRESGRVNMFGAVPELRRTFEYLTKQEATDILKYWMESFTKKIKE